MVLKRSFFFCIHMMEKVYWVKLRNSIGTLDNHCCLECSFHNPTNCKWKSSLLVLTINFQSHISEESQSFGSLTDRIVSDFERENNFIKKLLWFWIKSVIFHLHSSWLDLSWKLFLYWVSTWLSWHWIIWR